MCTLMTLVYIGLFVFVIICTVYIWKDIDGLFLCDIICIFVLDFLNQLWTTALWATVRFLSMSPYRECNTTSSCFLEARVYSHVHPTWVPYLICKFEQLVFST